MALNSLSNLTNSNNTGGSSGGSSGSFFKQGKVLGTMLVFLLILVVIFSIIMIIIAVSYPKKVQGKDKNEEVLLNFIHNCRNNPLKISTKELEASTSGNEYSITFWFFVNDLDALYLKSADYPHFDILTKGKVETLPTPNGETIEAINTNQSQPIKIYLENKSNTLRVEMEDESISDDFREQQSGCYHYEEGKDKHLSVDSLVSMGPQFSTEQDCSKEAIKKGLSYFGMDPNNKCYHLTNLDITHLKTDYDTRHLTKKTEYSDRTSCFTEGFYSGPASSPPPPPTAPSPTITPVLPTKKFYVVYANQPEAASACQVEQIPIQRWICMTLNVHNNIVDVFMDGKLKKTCIYPSNLVLNDDEIIIGNRGGFDGYVSNITWSTKALSANEIYEKYTQGPRIRLTVNDRIKYMFTKAPDSVEASLEQIDYVNEQSTGRL